LSEVPVVRVRVRHFDPRTTDYEPEKVLREMQTLHAGCNKVQSKMFAPLQTTFPGPQDGRNLISQRWSLPLPKKPSL